MYNPFRAMSGLKAVLVKNKTAKLSDADIVGAFVNLENLKSLYNSQIFDEICNKYTAYMKCTDVRLYDFEGLFIRICEISCGFSECCGSNPALNTGVVAVQMMLPGQVSGHIKRRDQIGVECNKLVEKALDEVEQFGFDRINPAAFRYCATWYFAAITSILINNLTSVNYVTLINLFQRTIHENATDMEFWHAIRRYKNMAADFSKSKYGTKQSIYDDVAQKLMNYGNEIDKIMSSGHPALKKCKDLGNALLSVNGIRLVGEAGIPQYLFIETYFDDFVKYVLEKKM